MLQEENDAQRKNLYLGGVRCLCLGAVRTGFSLFENDERTVFADVAAREAVARSGNGGRCGSHAGGKSFDNCFDTRAGNKDVAFPSFGLACVVGTGAGSAEVEGCVLPAPDAAATGRGAHQKLCRQRMCVRCRHVVAGKVVGLHGVAVHVHDRWLKDCLSQGTDGNGKHAVCRQTRLAFKKAYGLLSVCAVFQVRGYFLLVYFLPSKANAGTRTGKFFRCAEHVFALHACGYFPLAEGKRFDWLNLSPDAKSFRVNLFELYTVLYAFPLTESQTNI